MFKFADKPLSKVNDLWLAGIKLYINVIAKVWFLVFAIAIATNFIPFILKMITNYLRAQNRPAAIALTIFVTILIIGYFMSVTLHRMYSIGKDPNSSLLLSFKAVWEKYTTIVIAMIIVILLSMFGGLLLIIPGVFVAVLFICHLPLILFENKGVWGALKGSTKLVWGSWWRTFFVFAPVVILSFVFNLVLTYYFVDKLLLLHVASVIMFTLYYPFVYSLLLVSFNDLRLRKIQ